MGRVVTQSDIDEVPPGGTLQIAADATVTPLAEERARKRGVRIERGGRPAASAPRGAGGSDDRELVRAVTRAVVARLGSAKSGAVDAVVGEVLASMSGGAPAAGGGRPEPITTPRGAQLLPVVGAGAPPVDYCQQCVNQEKARKRSRAVLTATGRNTKGVVAKVASRIAELGGDILDISQTLVGDFFTMIIVVDVGALNAPFERFQEEVNAAARELGCQAMTMHEDVLTSLHRV